MELVKKKTFRRREAAGHVSSSSVRSGCKMYCNIKGQYLVKSQESLGSCPQLWGPHYYIILKIFVIAGLYSVLW